MLVKLLGYLIVLGMSAAMITMIFLIWGIAQMYGVF